MLQCFMNNLISTRAFQLKSCTQIICEAASRPPSQDLGHFSLWIVTTVYLSVQYKSTAVKHCKLVRVAESSSVCPDIALAANSFVKFCYGVKLIREQHCPSPTDHTMPHEAVENQNRLVGFLYQRPFNFRKLLGPSAHGWFLSLKDICITEFKALYRFFEDLNAFPDMI